MSTIINNSGPIGVFDSGYGGLTVLKEMVKQLPSYNFLYLGDNARAPYGPRSFETVYHYTLQCVNWFFSQGCSLVILACNTASAKALRTIQQQDLPKINNTKRVLGVIRPTTEIIGNYTNTNCVGVLGTTGTVQSQSYPIEIKKFYPQIHVFQEACPMWVSLVENNEHNKPGADYFIKQHLQNLLVQDANIDTILLACTHYPLLIDKIKSFLPDTITVLSQGDIVANSLKNYLHRHQIIEAKCDKGGNITFYTTDSVEDFNSKASIFYGNNVEAVHINLV
ncbi:MAG: glutamate racemase [Deinococcales bacterium]|nr:glutamate racemase [Chitinophagaceae bacterium]